MKDVFEKVGRESQGELDRSVAESLASLNMSARASLVNRTHRVVRERAKAMSARRSRMRSLWAPLAVCASLLVILVTAVWTTVRRVRAEPDRDAGRERSVCGSVALVPSGLRCSVGDGVGDDVRRPSAAAVRWRNEHAVDTEWKSERGQSRGVDRRRSTEPDSALVGRAGNHRLRARFSTSFMA